MSNSQNENNSVVLDKRLDYVNAIMDKCINNNTIREHNIERHEYNSPIQHHESKLILHSMSIHQNISDFEYIFPSYIYIYIYIYHHSYYIQFINNNYNKQI